MNAELKKCLYCLFSQFGKIADVQCCKTNKLRGQAWLIFADVASATNALQCMNGFPFFEKKLVCYLPYLCSEYMRLVSQDCMSTLRKRLCPAPQLSPYTGFTGYTVRQGRIRGFEKDRGRVEEQQEAESRE